MTQSRLLPRLAQLVLLAALAACDSIPTGAPSLTRLREGPAPLLTLRGSGQAVPGRYIVVMRQGASVAAAAQQLASSHGARVHYEYQRALTGFAATLSPQALDAIRRNPMVKYVAPDAMAYPSDVEQTGATWGLDRIDQRWLPLSTTYTYGPTGAGVNVYIIDTGIRTSHNEFGGRASVGHDFVGDGQNGQDCNGHGTHVAGTVAGTTYGVAKGADVIAVRVFGCSGGATFSTIIAAVDWVTANGTTPGVVNMSLGGGFYQPLNDAVAASIADGFTYALAAGNSDENACDVSPASTPAALTVGSTTEFDQRSFFSNWGACLDIFAPGSFITSAWWNGDNATSTISGTSMATPHVAGVAALYLEGAPTATPAQVADAIVGSGSLGPISDTKGSPNILLYSPLTPMPPAPVIDVGVGMIIFTFLNEGGEGASLMDAIKPNFTVGGAGVAKSAASKATRPHLVTTTSAAATTAATASGGFLISNSGTGPLDWTTSSDQLWLTSSPTDGYLNPGSSVNMTATVNSSTLADGQHFGNIFITDPAAVNTGASFLVAAFVADVSVLSPGVPVSGLTAAYPNVTYFKLVVPPGVAEASVEISGGTGDADLYVRIGSPPDYLVNDCAPFLFGNVEKCSLLLPPPGTYYIMVDAFDDYDGVQLVAKFGGPPFAASALSGTAISSSQIDLTWTDGSSNETQFRLYRRVQNPDLTFGPWSQIATPSANATSYSNTGLTGGTSYQYRIRACNAAGCSAYTASGIITTSSATAPAAPTTLTATVASAVAINVSWTDASNNETQFRLYRRIQNADLTFTAWVQIATPAANVTSYNDNGLSPETKYQYRIRACNSVGCSAYKASAIVTTPALPPPPDAPTTLSASVVSSTAINLTWTDASSNEEYFRLYRRIQNPDLTFGEWVQIAMPPVNSTAYGDTGLSAATSYQYRIRACNPGGCSAYKASSVVTTPGS